MLNKDEYNQEEYNDYYRQETQGAELNGSNDDESGGMGKIIGLIILIALAVAGYFGYKMMGTSDESIDTSLKVSMDNLPQSVQSETKAQKSDEPIEQEQKETQKSDEPVQQEQTKTTEKTHTTKSTPKVEVATKETQKEKTLQDEVSNKVQQTINTSESKISPEELNTIIVAVMEQIKQEKKSSMIQKNNTVTKQDKELMNELSTTEVDSVSADLESALGDVDINENRQINNTKKQVDVYNKVTVQESKGTDSLSQLSAQISSEIEDATASANTSKEDKEYSTKIKKEVISRKKEMRIIIVKKGDTLGKLAKRAYGNVMEYKRIYKANPEITRPDRIYIGQKIRIPLD